MTLPDLRQGGEVSELVAGGDHLPVALCEVLVAFDGCVSSVQNTGLIQDERLEQFVDVVDASARLGLV